MKYIFPAFILLSVIFISCSNLDEFKNPESVVVNSLAFNSIEDGVYTGKYIMGAVKAVVKVTVINHSIKEIKIVKHRTGQGHAAEKITNKVIESQNLQVDAITGATISSKCILKSIENALE